MNTMIDENEVVFKSVEKEIFSYVCHLGCQAIKEMLESLDRELMENRDKSIYRNKGSRKTTIKTLCGEVTFNRTVYEVAQEDGLKRCVYLLDETIGLKGIGLFSPGYVEQLLSGITEMSYRVCAEQLSNATGQVISAMGVWGIVQRLGEYLEEEEEHLVQQHKRNELRGELKSQVIFEENDGVYIELQGKDRTKTKKSAEMKLSLAYDGWKVTGSNRYVLQNKVATAGFERAKDFARRHEAKMAAKYDLDNTRLRVLNADGANWTKNKIEVDCFQLDPFHRNKAIQTYINRPDAAKAIRELLYQGKVEELLSYLEKYRDSLSDDKEIKDADTLLMYYRNNKEGLLSYKKQVQVPEPEEGIVYRNLGTMEGHVWSIIARRMKNNHTCWSIAGGGHMGKLLALKESGMLDKALRFLNRPVFEKNQLERIKEEIPIPHSKLTEGSGYQYPVTGHIKRLDNSSGITRKSILHFVGC